MRTAPERFTAEFIRATADIQLTQLARSLGCSRQNLAELRKGRLPGPRLAAVLAEALDAPLLLSIVNEARSRTCEVCEAPMYAMTVRRRYCSYLCERVGTITATKRLSVVETDAMAVVSEVRTAVAAFCRACEPAGLCRQPACELRPVSPLPVEGVVPMLEISPRLTGWTPERKASQAERMRGRPRTHKYATDEERTAARRSSWRQTQRTKRRRVEDAA